MGFLSSKSSTSQAFRTTNKLATDNSTSDVGQNFAGQAAAGRVSNLVDSTVTQTVQNFGLAGEDLVNLVSATVEPVTSAVETQQQTLGQAFSQFSAGLAAATSSTAGVTALGNNAIEAIKSAAIPIAIVLAIWGLARFKR